MAKLVLLLFTTLQLTTSSCWKNIVVRDLDTSPSKIRTQQCTHTRLRKEETQRETDTREFECIYFPFEIRCRQFPIVLRATIYLFAHLTGKANWEREEKSEITHAYNIYVFCTEIQNLRKKKKRFGLFTGCILEILGMAIFKASNEEKKKHRTNAAVANAPLKKRSKWNRL